ncbi:hypothetical protein N7456_000570 [Penicillium angulare]|uniref:Uncharacterized protein n=1 Tax=Penicillium angulare TaxID=116970 RepID=A0A9W9KR22_9EURO|nr:hypothetical protein N7456_000570 [Penicillium angulare]
MAARVVVVDSSKVEKNSKEKVSRKSKDKVSKSSSQKSKDKGDKSSSRRSKVKGSKIEIIEVEVPTQNYEVPVHDIKSDEKTPAKPSKKSKRDTKLKTSDSHESPSSSEKKKKEKRKSSGSPAESVHGSVQSESNGHPKKRLKQKSPTTPAGLIYGPAEIKDQDEANIPRASDPTPRKILRVQDLDLWRAYEPEPEVEQIIERPEKPKIYYDIGPKALEDPSKLPEDWTSEELDLDPDDLDAQIHRCEERIQANIMPKVFRKRLENFKAERIDREETRKKYSGVSWDVIHRLESLSRIIAKLVEDGDKYEEMANVKALMVAYASQKLVWNNGLVTYWSRGVQLSQPRPFDWDEFEAINKKYNGDKGFWVEGIIGPTPGLNMLKGSFGPAPFPQQDLNFVQIYIRLPGKEWHQHMDFLHDTGSSTMTMYEGDIDDLQAGNLNPERVPILGLLEVRIGSGEYISSPLIQVEGTLIQDGVRLLDWARILTTVSPGRYRGRLNPRSDGPILRQILSTTFVPDGDRVLHVTNKHADLNKLLGRRRPGDPEGFARPATSLETVRVLPEPRAAQGARDAEAQARAQRGPRRKDRFQRNLENMGRVISFRPPRRG